jgi:hypothetical protein
MKRFQQIGNPKRRAKIDELQQWLLSDYVAMRHLFDLPIATAHALAQSPDRWARLRTWVPVAFVRQCPTDISVTGRRLLHILSYVVEGWAHTSMGRAPHEARELWFKQFDNVRRMCAEIAAASDWSSSTAWLQKGLDVAVKETSAADASGSSSRN